MLALDWESVILGFLLGVGWMLAMSAAVAFFSVTKRHPGEGNQDLGTSDPHQANRGVRHRL